MRFPENKVMTRYTPPSPKLHLFGVLWLSVSRLVDLFATLKMEKLELQDAPIGSLVPYYIQNIKDGEGLEPFRYNKTTRWGNYKKIAEKAQGFDAWALNGDAADSDHTIPAAYGSKVLNLAGTRDG